MSGRRTNLALLALLVTVLVTGALSFAIGTSSLPALAHGVAGAAIVLLAPWKSLVVRRGWARGRRVRWASLLLAVLVTVSLVSGFLFSTGAVLHYGPFNAMQVHVGSALLAVLPAVVHLASRRVPLRRADLGRRNLVRAGALLGAAGVVYVGLEGVGRLLRFPGRRRRFTGSHERGSFDPAAMPTTQWIDDPVPRIDASEWRLRISSGAGDREVGLDDIAASHEVVATLDCTSGWYSTQQWSGIRLDTLLDDGASFVVRSATGYRRRFPMRDASHMLLATHLGGEPLSPGHGFPARIVAPGRRGFWWVKWVEEIVVDDRPWWLQSPFPLT